jgi:opacity protein-like surface antigen
MQITLTKEDPMTIKTAVVSLGILGALVTGSGPAMAQVQADTNELHVYAGQLFGDHLTDRSVSGEVIELDDDFTYGIRYGRNFTESWGLEVSTGYSPNSATGVPGGDVGLNLGILDVDAVWHFTPKARTVGYLVAGVGYAIASLDDPIQGTVNGQPASIDDGGSFTLNAGIGVKFFPAKAFMIRAEARYRYIDSLLEKFDDSLSTVETTAGVGWKF